MPGDHLEVAAAITYAGTPNHSERQWAIDHGWYTREFTVSWDSTCTVLDAGIPFTLTTPEVTSSHLQAVIGYDEVRNTLIIRDPGERNQVEMLAEGLDRYRSSGPRGIAMVPIDQKHRLESLELPETELYDQIFRMERALEAHDRDGAEGIMQKMIASAGEQRMTFVAERMLAGYDADSVRLLSAIDKLLTLFPDDLRLHLSKVSLLKDLARRSEFFELLESLSKQPNTDPAFWEQYAQELAGDARRSPEAVRWLKKAIRVNPGSARAFNVLAGISWSEPVAKMLSTSRIAACLEQTSEYLPPAISNTLNFWGQARRELTS